VFGAAASAGEANASSPPRISATETMRVKGGAVTAETSAGE